jgi:predicted RNA binding protein YcfA (HicA-like mRNA interferase family)
MSEPAGLLRKESNGKGSRDITKTVPLQVKDDIIIVTDVKVRDAIKLVESDGWKVVRTRGSHRQYHHPVKPGTVTIAGHPSIDLDPKTQASILKQAGLKE